jgi:hypothetical protein
VKRSVRVSHLICAVNGAWLEAKEGRNGEDLLRERQRSGRRLATPVDVGGALRLRRGQGRADPLGARFMFFAPLLSLKSQIHTFECSATGQDSYLYEGTRKVSGLVHCTKWILRGGRRKVGGELEDLLRVRLRRGSASRDSYLRHG